MTGDAAKEIGGQGLPTYQNGSRDQTPSSNGELPTDDSAEQSSSYYGLSLRHKRLILTVCSLISMCAQMSLSILSAFFPLEARLRGLSEETVGWVFSVYSLVQLFVSPLTGLVAAQLGVKYITTVGAAVGGTASLALGFTNFLPDSTSFTAVFVLLRIVQAAGMSSCATASFSIAVNTYFEDVNFAVGVLEGAVGVGVMVGPSLGGCVYDLGGFQLPFYITGAIILTAVPLTIFVIPTDTSAERRQMQSKGLDMTMCRMLKFPPVLVACLAIIVISMVWLVFDPTLEPFLHEEFDLSATLVGLAFLLMAGCYAGCSPLAGWAADKVHDKGVLLGMGFGGAGIFLLFVGPSPTFHVDFTQLWLVLVALALTSVCLSFANVPSLGKILDTCAANGIENDMKSYSAIAGLWYTLNALGEACGPVLGSYVVKGLSFEWLCTVLSGICFTMMIILGVLYLYEHHCKRFTRKKPTEETRLIEQK